MTWPLRLRAIETMYFRRPLSLVLMIRSVAASFFLLRCGTVRTPVTRCSPFATRSLVMSATAGASPRGSVTVLVAAWVLGRRRGVSGTALEKTLDSALGPVCSVILITGAGGMFGGVLELSGIGEALSGSLSDLGLPLVVSAFVIATLLRVAQGSATVALVTTAGLIAPGVEAADPGALQLVALVIAIAAGATVLSHVNDSGFWLVSRFFQMDEKTTLRTWTVMETTLGLTAFALAGVLWVVG